MANSLGEGHADDPTSGCHGVLDSVAPAGCVRSVADAITSNRSTATGGYRVRDRRPDHRNQGGGKGGSCIQPHVCQGMVEHHLDLLDPGDNAKTILGARPI